MHSGEDKILWDYYPKGSFTMKEAYDLFTVTDIKPMEQKWKELWKKQLWPKVTVFS